MKEGRKIGMEKEIKYERQNEWKENTKDRKKGSKKNRRRKGDKKRKKKNAWLQERATTQIA